MLGCPAKAIQPQGGRAQLRHSLLGDSDGQGAVQGRGQKRVLPECGESWVPPQHSRLVACCAVQLVDGLLEEGAGGSPELREHSDHPERGAGGRRAQQQQEQWWRLQR